jgi:hypothetical protein
MPRGLDLTSDWWSGWQTYRDGTEHVAVQPVHFAQEDDLLEVAATAHGLSKDEGGGYLWRGELRLWDNALLMGWYAAVDGSVRSKGTMYFALGPHGCPRSACGSASATTGASSPGGRPSPPRRTRSPDLSGS